MIYFENYSVMWNKAQCRQILLPGIFFLASLYSSAGRAELPADNIFSRVEQLAREQLAQQAATAGLLEPQFQVTVVKSTRPVPACAAPVALETADSRSAQRMRFVAVCPGSNGWRYEMLARGSITAQVAVTSVPVTANTPLQSGDVTLARRDVTMVPDSISALPGAIGLSSRRSLRAGEVLRQGQLASPVLIKRGSAVSIVARKEQVEVSMAGEAMDPGALGEVIRVRNATSGTVIRARVVDAGVVEPADIAGR
ncbi:flagella basal body P-ring formation protein FlgA [Janthinobacterium lividum]|uniref:Flagella basal body P-ring formation protein FlgA n=1 Tax=Janthinobacterium lividum TaxID=29581 RepID=A0AB38C9E7_9BURK|nr:Flagella basal body P-ring formation protein FlgA [Janthinobacterium lividum]SFX75638.1 flagella basal body P-ring formation protein FlgA [Janthinobacterium lividum]